MLLINVLKINFKLKISCYIIEVMSMDMFKLKYIISHIILNILSIDYINDSRFTYVIELL